MEDKKIVVRNIKRNLLPGGISEKGWQSSQALGLACDKWGIPRPREGRGACSQLAKWGLCVVGFHGTHWGALTGPSSIPDSLAPFCHSPLLSPHGDRGERQGITPPDFACLHGVQLWFFPHRTGRPDPSQPVSARHPFVSQFLSVPIKVDPRTEHSQGSQSSLGKPALTVCSGR